MLSILGFLAVLGPLVIVHEMGHFLFAKLFGVKAEVFSIGFGPRIWSKQIGETEWKISAIPLGGFVKLMGEEPDSKLTEAELKRSLPRQAPWKRFFIFFGGPLFNFIWAIIVFMAILLIGEPQLSSYVGRVVQGSHAEQSGLRSGDQIVAIDGKAVKKFEEVMNVVNDKPAQKIDFAVIHDGTMTPTHVTVTPTIQDGYSVYGEATHVGEIDGLIPTARSTAIGLSNPESLAAKAGLKTGDELLSLNGTALKDWESFEKRYNALPAGSTAKIMAQSSKDQKDSKEFKGLKEAKTGTVTAQKDFTFTKPAVGKSVAADLGLHSSELFVDKPVPQSPAEKAGIKPGDRLVGIGTQDIHSFFELKDAVQRAGEKDGKVEVRWERDGKITTASLTPTGTQTRDVLLKKTVQFTIGVVPMLSWAEPVTFIERIYNPFTLVFKATERMVVFSWRNFVSITKMFTGEVSVATLGGPILIGKIAGESISRGLIAFLSTMAILSVGLGVLNILPIPVLDGGHLLLLAIEAIRKRPLTIRQTEIIQQVGLSLILLLMVVVIKNDLSRLPLFN
ncbi:MAG: RIP metalloprotease RseP [Methylotenera sp.]|nr:RIP metalloprotease RseP [Oligoflexia bacterium]